MWECNEIKDKDMTKSKDQGFTFTVNMGERIYKFMTESELDRKKWVKSLRQSAKTSREMHNGEVK